MAPEEKQRFDLEAYGDELLAEMQTPEVRRGIAIGFHAPIHLGQKAVEDFTRQALEDPDFTLDTDTPT